MMRVHTHTYAHIFTIIHCRDTKYIGYYITQPLYINAKYLFLPVVKMVHQGPYSSRKDQPFTKCGKIKKIFAKVNYKNKC